MKRLFTFGCSYTAYEFYPTWADLLGLEFESFENWGVSGAGCRAIAERVAECHSKNNFTKDDVIIVQWSSHLRHDYFNPASVKRKYNIGWKTFGNIFNDANRDVFTDQWLKDFFFEPAYIMHCLNNMILVQGLLKSTGCKWYMTSIGDWTKLGTDLHPELTKVDLKDYVPDFKPYINEIWDNHHEHWIKPIALDAAAEPNLCWWFNDANNPKEQYQELHPSPRQYADWLNNRVRLKLGLGPPPTEQEDWISQLEEIKKEGNNFIEYLKTAYTTNKYLPPTTHWPLEYKGF